MLTGNIRDIMKNLSIGRLRLSILVAVLASMATACSGSAEVQNIVPLDSAPPGAIYVSNSAGELYVVDPGDATGTLVLSSADQAPLGDLVAVEQGTKVHGVVLDSLEPFTTSVVNFDGSALESIMSSNGDNAVVCVDPHAGSAMPIAHLRQTRAGTQTFEPVTYPSGDVLEGVSSLDMNSVLCPRWSSDRTVVATTLQGQALVGSTISTVVQGIDGSRTEIALEGCGVKAAGISPDDEHLVLNVTCYASKWEESGLYLTSLSDLLANGAVGDLDKIGSGLFGDTSWHPDGEWIAAARAEPIPNQGAAIDLSDQPASLQLIEVATGQTIDIDVGGAEASNPAWLVAAISA